MKKRLNIAVNLMIVGWLFFFALNVYFGWNRSPESEAEEICDMIFKYWMILAFIIYISPLFKLYEVLVDMLDDKIKKKNEN